MPALSARPFLVLLFSPPPALPFRHRFISPFFPLLVVFSSPLFTAFVFFMLVPSAQIYSPFLDRASAAVFWIFP